MTFANPDPYMPKKLNRHERRAEQARQVKRRRLLQLLGRAAPEDQPSIVAQLARLGVTLTPKAAVPKATAPAPTP